MIRVLIVDDHAFIRASLAAVLSQSAGLLVVGECADGRDVLAMASSVRPDVVLMDIQMPVLPGLDATRELLAVMPDVRVIMLTGLVSARIVDTAAEAGAVGFLRKGDSVDRLVSAVRVVAAGGTSWPVERPAPGEQPGSADRPGFTERLDYADRRSSADRHSATDRLTSSTGPAGHRFNLAAWPARVGVIQTAESRSLRCP